MSHFSNTAAQIDAAIDKLNEDGFVSAPLYIIDAVKQRYLAAHTVEFKLITVPQKRGVPQGILYLRRKSQ